MKHPQRPLCLLLALLLLCGALPSSALAAEYAPKSPIAGMLVRSRNNADFPSAPNQSAKAMRRQLDALTDYAVQGGYHAIFFEVRPEGGALYSSDYFPSSRFLVKKQG
ncbi:MAG: hypothetical protein RRY21_06820, partial [Oscillospiraceae bacterium]